MAHLSWETMDTDVLVIGGGSAGCLAALQASANGARVLLASKVGLGSGCSMMARGGFQAAMHPDDSPDVHYQDTIRAGCGLNNQRLAWILCQEIPEIVRQLDRWGVEFVKKDGDFDQKWVVGSTHPRHIHHFDTTGKALMHGLARHVGQKPVTTLPHAMLVDLVLQDGKASGAWGLLPATGRLLFIRAGAVVLASGGASRVFAVSDNPIYITGDGHAMALRAGAECVDMEMVEFQLSVRAPEKLSSYPPNSSAWIARGARLYNGLGERFMRRYDPERLEKTGRSAINIACGSEVYYGRGTPSGGIYLDCSDIPPETLEQVGPDIVAAFRRAGVDLRYQPMELAPGSHDFLGGVRIDEQARTAVDGLFAAGEVAGGVHGANRLGGNALSAALVFGTRAGRYAADFALRRTPTPVDTGWQGAAESKIAELEGEGLDPLALRQRVQEMMTRYVGVVRDGDGLRQTAEELARIEAEELPGLRVSPGPNSFRAIQQLQETANVVQVARVIATSALCRTESRGFHHRADCPQTDDANWRRSIVIARGPEGLAWRTAPVVERS